MATVYKIEIELISDWINYPPKDLERIIKERVEVDNTLLKDDIRICEIKVIRTA